MIREHVQQSADEWDRRDAPGRNRVWLECGTHDASKLQHTETGEDYCWMCMTLFDGDAALNPPDDQAVSPEPVARRRRVRPENSVSRTMTLEQVQQSADKWDQRDAPGRKRVWLECGSHDASKLERTEAGEHYCWMCLTLFDGDAAVNPPDDRSVSPEPVVRQQVVDHENLSVARMSPRPSISSKVGSLLRALWNPGPRDN